MSHEPSADTSESNHGKSDSVGQRPDGACLHFGSGQIEKLQQTLDAINSNLSRSIREHNGDHDEDVEDSSVNKSDNGNGSDDDGVIDDGGVYESDEPLSNVIIPEVKDCDLGSFYAAASGEARYAIETLVQERFDWSQSATRLPKGRRGKNDDSSPSFHPPHPQPAHHERPWLCKIRVNSTAIVIFIQCAAGRALDLTRPMVFQWPFRTMLYHHNRAKRLMDSLELRKETGKRKGNQEEDDYEVLIDDDYIELLTSKEALSEIRCFVGFVEQRLLPDHHRFEDATSPRAQMVYFDQLWNLFRPGDLIFVPKPSQGPTSSNYQTMWKLLQVLIPKSTDTIALPSDLPKYTDRNLERSKDWNVALHMYYLDHDGTRYGAVSREFEIEPFPGQREVTSLPCYPLRFVKGHARLLEEVKREGAKFIDVMTQKRGFYAGWTWTKDPLGRDIKDVSGKAVNIREHIESDILIDYQEAFNANPNNMPPFFTMSVASHGWEVDEDVGYIAGSREFLVVRDHVEIDEMNDLVDGTPHLEHDTPRNEREAWMPTSDDDLAILPRQVVAYALWSRKFVHIDVRNIELWKREGEGEDQSESTDTFDQLQIPGSAKRLIQSLVHSHFMKKDLENRGVDLGTLDLIRGKGKGVVILLHGPPGVGKTATAEAVAQRWEKPLFTITCGDLGSTPADVERELEEKFRLAHLWDCVLLLDEADVFITQRQLYDLERNALVSGMFENPMGKNDEKKKTKIIALPAAADPNRTPVFLRTLEYYNGILFLTTNRVGVLDEAVKSRVHLSLQYSAFDEDQTVKVFRLNIERLRSLENRRVEALKAKRMEVEAQQNRGHDFFQEPLYIDEEDIISFARRQFSGTARSSNSRPPTELGRWNGRQIRNAFLIAASLAQFDARNKPGLQRQLRGSHFEEVYETTLHFDEYRADVLGQTDSNFAWGRMERARNPEAGGTASEAGGRTGPGWRSSRISHQGMAANR